MTLEEVAAAHRVVAEFHLNAASKAPFASVRDSHALLAAGVDSWHSIINQIDAPKSYLREAAAELDVS